jgi:predicted DNA-binding ribbon-helix-helix protein
VKISDLIASLDTARENSNLSSAIRVFILDHYCAMAGDLGTIVPRYVVDEGVKAANATLLPLPAAPPAPLDS